MSDTQTTNDEAQEARTVATEAADHGMFDIKELVLYAVLLAAGIILNLTVGKLLSATGVISPEFMIASFCITILITRPGMLKAAIIGLIAGVIIQITASVKGPDLVAETLAAMAMAAIVKALMGTGAKAFVPAIGTFVTTFISGMVYAVIVAFFVRMDSSLIGIMLPVVLLTGVFNAVLVSALYIPIKKALKVQD